METSLISFRVEDHLRLNHLGVEHVHVHELLTRGFVRLTLYSVGIDLIEVEGQGSDPFVSAAAVNSSIPAFCPPTELSPGGCRSLGVIVMLIDASLAIRPARVSTARSASSSEKACVHIFSSGYLFDSMSRRAGSYARRS